MKLDGLDLNKLMTFLAIAESGAVSAASRRVGLTRSAVSHSLRGLESLLGVQLFHRVGKRMVLTNEGRLLRDACGDVRQRLEDAFGEVFALGREVRGTVRLGVYLGFSRFRLAALVDAFVRAHAGAGVRIAYGGQPWLIEQLLAAKLDLVLALRPGSEYAAQIRSSPLAAAPLVLATRADDNVRVRSFEQLCRLAFVDYYRSEPLIDRWTGHHFGPARVPRDRIRAWVATTDLALELVLRGTGASVLPADLVEPFRKSKALRIIAGAKAPLSEPIWLNELSTSRRTRAVESFRESLER